MAQSETEREALALVALKEDERDASREVTRLKNDLTEAERRHAEAREALTKARESFVRKMQ